MLKTIQIMQIHYQIWNFIFFHLVNNDISTDCKQLVRHNSVLSFCTLTVVVQLLHAKEVYFCSFVTKSNQACMKYSPKCIYITVSITQSHMERSTESFIKKSFFRCNGHPIFLHLNLFPNKNPPKQVHTILSSSTYPSTQVHKTHEPSH